MRIFFILMIFFGGEILAKNSINSFRENLVQNGRSWQKKITQKKRRPHTEFDRKDFMRWAEYLRTRPENFEPDPIEPGEKIYCKTKPMLESEIARGQFFCGPFGFDDYWH